MEPSYGIPGEFIPTRFVNYIVANSVRLDRGELFHEHTHLYLYNQMPGVYPLWFDDGLAVFMARAQFTETEAQFFPTRRGDAGGWIPTARLLRVTRTSPEYLSEKELYSFHFQSYAMVYRALVDEPEFGTRVFQYLEEFNNLRPPDEAEKALGESLEDLDFKMHAYLNTSGKKRVSLKLDGVKDLELPPGTPVSRLDSLLEIATVCLDGGLHLDMVHELLDAADGEPGGNPRAMPLRMRLAARLKDDAKLEELYGILSKESDARVARAAGLALFERVQTLDEQSSARRTDLMTRSFDLLNRSLATQADDPEAVWAFAMLSADLKRDLDVALQRLVPMFDRLPSNPDMAHAAGKVLYARGDQNVMPYLTAVLRYAHTIEQKRWALERINALRAKAAAPRDAPAQ
jgi:hypothetical protein